MALVRNHVEGESKLGCELVPIHLQVPEERIAADWDQVLLAENAIINIVQVRCTININCCY